VSNRSPSNRTASRLTTFRFQLDQSNCRSQVDGDGAFAQYHSVPPPMRSPVSTRAKK
jgi:hypothetical protein